MTYLLYSSDTTKLENTYDMYRSILEGRLARALTNKKLETTYGITLYFISNTLDLCGLRIDKYICLDDDIDKDTLMSLEASILK